MRAILDPEHEKFRAQTREKMRRHPAPLPKAERGARLAYRLVPKYTRAESAQSLISGGAFLTIAGAAATAGMLYFVDFDHLSASPFLLAGAAITALLTLLGAWLLASGLRLRGVIHVPPPIIELSAIDLHPGGTFQLAFIQPSPARLEEVVVDLICDETIIETAEIPLEEDEARVTRNVVRTSGGRYIKRLRTPHTSRVHEQRLVEQRDVDASSRHSFASPPSPFRRTHCRPVRAAITKQSGRWPSAPISSTVRTSESTTLCA